MKLEDVVDLEAQLAVDRDRDPEVLRARDRTIFTRLPDPASRPALIANWLAALRERGESPAIGPRLVRGLRWTRRWLLVGMLLAGWATATGLLAFSEGGPPVNVGTFLLVVVGAQLALLALFVVGLLVTRAFPNAPLFGDVRGLVRLLANALARLGDRATERLPSDQRHAFARIRARLRSRGSLYGPIERWTLIGITQSAAAAFNLGILVGCLRLIVLSDLAFGWSTTANAIDSDAMVRVVHALSRPWAELAPEAVPSRELIEKSRYFRLEERYADAPPGARGHAAIVGGWWPFLIAATVTYGLVPRLLLTLVAAVMRARALARVPLDVPEVEQIVRRLRAPRLRTRGASSPSTDAERMRPLRAAPSRPEAGRPCLVVRWRDADAPEDTLRTVLAERFGWSVSRVADAIGDEDTPLPGEVTADQAVVVVAESWEAPDKGLRRWLAALRARLAPAQPIWVLLFAGRVDTDLQPARAEEVDVWRDRLDLVEDPYLGVESVEAA